jgi:hypothetical protein
MKTLRERYQGDAQFRALVDILVYHIDREQYTPSDMREASMLASIIYEERNIWNSVATFVESDV